MRGHTPSRAPSLARLFRTESKVTSSRRPSCEVCTRLRAVIGTIRKRSAGTGRSLRVEGRRRVGGPPPARRGSDASWSPLRSAGSSEENPSPSHRPRPVAWARSPAKVNAWTADRGTFHRSGLTRDRDRSRGTHRGGLVTADAPRDDGVTRTCAFGTHPLDARRWSVLRWRVGSASSGPGERCGSTGSSGPRRR